MLNIQRLERQIIQRFGSIKTKGSNIVRCKTMELPVSEGNIVNRSLVGRGNNQA